MRHVQNVSRTELRGLSSRANYTDLATLVGEVSAHFYGYRVSRSLRNGYPRQYC
jgi:hypothetical protein